MFFSRGLASSFHSVPLSLSLSLSILSQAASICMSLESYTIWLYLSIWSGVERVHFKCMWKPFSRVSYISRKYIMTTKAIWHQPKWSWTEREPSPATTEKKTSHRPERVVRHSKNKNALARDLSSLPKPAEADNEPMRFRPLTSNLFRIPSHCVSIWPAAATTAIRFARVNK